LPEAITNTIIVLIGFAGTGKYTIGRELADRMAAKLIDNHLINNSLFTAIDADGVTPLPQGIWPKIRKISASRVRQSFFKRSTRLGSSVPI